LFTAPKNKMEHQDWNSVVLGKKKSVKPKNAEHAAHLGAPTQMKSARPNKQTSGAVVNPKKLEDADATEHLPQISTDLKQQIARARQDKGWTQKELAAKINERVTLVADYEAGRGLPDQKIINKMSKALGVTLKK